MPTKRQYPDKQWNTPKKSPSHYRRRIKKLAEEHQPKVIETRVENGVTIKVYEAR